MLEELADHLQIYLLKMVDLTFRQFGAALAVDPQGFTCDLRAEAALHLQGEFIERTSHVA